MYKYKVCRQTSSQENKKAKEREPGHKYRCIEDNGMMTQRPDFDPKRRQRNVPDPIEQP